MKKEREFLTELYSNHIEEIPFLVHFKNDKQLKSKLFAEYLQTETKPNFSLYLSSHFSKTELDNGFAEIQNNIPVSENKKTIAGFVPNTDFENKISDVRNQFYDLVAKRELSEMYFSHSITETKVIKKLKLVQQEIKDFEQFVFDTTFYNPNDYAINFAKNIINKLESTALPKLKNEILTNFTSQQININLEIEFIINEIAPRGFSEKAKISKEEAGRKYRELKMYADVYINEYLKNNSIKENELLVKYKSIGYLDFKKVNTALSKIDTITEKLEYLKGIKEQYYDKYENLKTSLDEVDYIFYVNNSETFWQVVFGNYSLYSPLSIQKPVYNKFFSNGLKTPEFTYWFLKYDAENVFNHTINSKIFKDKLNSELKETFIKSELKQLEEQEQKAKDLLLNKELDIYNQHKNNYTYEKEVVLLRILDGNYYKENCTFKAGGWGTLEVQAYYKHILLKPYLEKQLKNNAVEKIIKKDIDSISDILESKKEETYVSPLKFDIFTQGYDEYIIEFKNNEPLVTKLILKYELDYYNFIKDIADYKFKGKDYKNPLPQEYYDEKEIEVSILEGLNAKKIFDNCFEIIDFLEQKNIEFEKQKPKLTKSDPRINLVDLSNHRLKNEVCHEFDRLLIHFQENKYLIVNKDYKIYSAGISYLFSTKNINAKNLETKEDFILNNKPYFDTFINAFKEGEKYFKDKFEVSKEVLYGNNSKTIVADIHQNYYHIIHSDSFTGWVGVIHSNPMLITHEIIKKYGYYSGILSKADAFISEYPNVFIDFHKCKNTVENNNQTNVSKPTKEEDIQKIKEILKPLSGNWKRDLILNESDFSNLIEYTLHIMEHNCLPNETKQFPITGASIEFIRKTIHLVYLHLGKKNKSCFVSLTHLFKQLDKTEVKTTNSKFSAYTGNYNNDLQTMITY